MSEWIRANKLSLNISKTNTMVFQKNLAVNNLIQIMIDNNKIQQVTSNKFLGVTINSDLTWKNHINLVTTKIARAIGVIRRIRYRLSKKTAMMLYETLIVSHISYGNIIWASSYKTYLQKIFLLQKRALKLCSGIACKSNQQFAGARNINARYITRNTSTFHINNKLSVYDINKYQIASLVYTALNNLSPPYLQNLFNPVANIHSYNTRAETRNNLFTRPAKTTQRKFATSVRATTVWNSIPDSIRNSDTLHLFSKNLKLFYLNKY